MGNEVWMAVTDDRYQLPLSVAESLTELGNLMGIAMNSLWYLYHNDGSSRYTFNGEHYKIIKVIGVCMDEDS